MVWNDSIFQGQLVFQNDYAISIQFTSSHSSMDCWILTNVYGPCQPEEKTQFISWFKNIQMPEDIDCLVLGNFNFIRSPSDRNAPGGDINNMFLFGGGNQCFGFG